MQFINAHNVPYVPDRWLSFDDVLMIPKFSTLESRNDPSIDLTTRFVNGVPLKLPILSSNMDTVTGSEMVLTLAQYGAFGILHRFYPSLEEYISEIKKIADKYKVVAFSIGANVQDLRNLERILNEVESNLYIVCIDVAHGHLAKCIKQVHEVVKGFGPKVKVIAGNVATAVGAFDLINAGAHAIKVGVGDGSLCTTRVVTGHGVPQLSAIMQCRQAINATKTNTALIADGGIRNSGDILKALAAGADTVMIGRLFAGTKETPGKPVGENGSHTEEIDWNYPQVFFKKKYRGQSSQEFLESIGKNNVSAEGESMYVPYQGTVVEVLKDLVGGIKSGMSYAGCSDLNKLNEYANFIEITHHGYIESQAHGLISV
jgi:IMP dehydrogenase